MTSAEVTGIRSRAGLTRTALAKLLGKTYRTILRWEDENAAHTMSRADEIVLDLLDKGELPSRFLEDEEAAQ